MRKMSGLQTLLRTMRDINGHKNLQLRLTSVNLTNFLIQVPQTGMKSRMGLLQLINQSRYMSEILLRTSLYAIVISRIVNY